MATPRSLFTFSGATRAMKCDLSMALPSADSPTEAATRGSVGHKFLEDVNKLGRDEALKRVPDEYRALCEAIDVDRLKINATQVASEITFAYNPFTGESRELGRNLNRQYEAAGLRENEIPGTLDICAIEGDLVVVDDWKFGRGYIEPAYVNGQLRLGALAACRALGKNGAKVSILRVYEDGKVWRDKFIMDAFELDDVELQFRAVAERGRRAREDHANGTLPKATMGSHCRYCPGLVYCPAQGALIRHVADNPAAFSNEIAILDEKTVAKAWERLKLVKQVAEVMDQALRTFAAQTPVKLASGSVLGPKRSTTPVFDGNLARDILAELFGADVAAKACEVRVSKAAIEAAVKDVAKERGETIKTTKDRALAVLQERGALRIESTEKIQEHKG